MAILNLTQHRATAAQLQQGIENVPSEHQEQLERLLTFPADYTYTCLSLTAKALAALAHELGYDAAMIGGMPSLMGHLERELIALNISVGYARTERVSADQVQPDGSVKKVSTFRHCGIYWAWERTPCPHCGSTDCGVVTRGATTCG